MKEAIKKKNIPQLKEKKQKINEVLAKAQLSLEQINEPSICPGIYKEIIGIGEETREAIVMRLITAQALMLEIKIIAHGQLATYS